MYSALLKRSHPSRRGWLRLKRCLIRTCWFVVIRAATSLRTIFLAPSPTRMREVRVLFEPRL